MRAEVKYIKNGLTTEEKYDVINQMPVSFEEFASKSSLYNRAYGVLVGGTDFGYSGPNGEDFQTLVLNRCARSAAYRTLLQVTDETERHLGYKFSERYLSMAEPWRGDKIQLPHPGVTDLEVKRQWYATDATSSLDFLLEELITLEDVGGVIYARVSAEIFENPNWAILRRRSDGRVLTPDKSIANAVTLDTGTNEWRIALLQKPPILVTDQVDAQHRRRVRFSYTKPLPVVIDLPDNAVFTPVYPGTNQIVPHDVVFEDEFSIVYESDVWLFVSPGFSDETVNWERFETYKLYQEIAFAYYAEVPEYLRLIWTVGTCQTVYQFDPDDPDYAKLPRLYAELVDSERGVVQFKANGRLISDLHDYWRLCCSCDCNYDMPMNLKVEIAYKVEPEALPHRLFDQIDDVKEGIVYRVAAELPTSDCGCPVGAGFIWEAQKPYDRAYMNPWTTTEVTVRQFGKLHGQLVYEEKLSSKQIYRRNLRVGKV